MEEQKFIDEIKRVVESEAPIKVKFKAIETILGKFYEMERKDEIIAANTLIDRYFTERSALIY